MVAGLGYAGSRLLGPKGYGIASDVAANLGLDAGNTPILMMLGPFKFSLNTACYSTKSQSTEAQWAAAPKFGGLDDLQFTGLGAEILELPGVLYPQWRGSSSSIDTLRTMARSGEPYYLVGPDGSVHGEHVIQSLRTEESLFQSDGTPRKITFTVGLRLYALHYAGPADAGRNPLDALRKKLGRYAGLDL